MKILITGITGFLGTHLMNSLKENHEIIGVSGTSKKYKNSTSKIKVYTPNELDNITKEVDVVVMCHAAVSSGVINIESKSLFEANVSFTGKILNSFPNAYNLFLSSVAVYGNNVDLINENTIVNPITEYAISKLWGEMLTSKNSKNGILRLTSLYGEGMQVHTIIPQYVNQAINQDKIEVWGDGSRHQNYLHISDAILYISNLIKNKLPGLYLAASKESYSNKELANIISNLTSKEFVHKGVDNASSRFYDNKISRLKLNIETECSLTDGLNNYIKWNKKQF